MATLEIAGGLLDVRLHPADPVGAGQPPLVFLHEGLGSADLWRDFPEAVRRGTGGPASLVYSRHGHGRSGRATVPLPVTYMHREAEVVLPELLARLGIDRPILIGHSDGASIAILFAGAGHAVAGLALLAPHVFVEEKSIDGIRAAADTYATNLRERLARHHDDVDATFWSWNNVWLSEEFRSWNIEDRLATIACPVLVVQGDADEYGTKAQVDAIKTGVGGPTHIVWLAGVGHQPHLEAPDVTLAEVGAFVAQVSSAEDSPR